MGWQHGYFADEGYTYHFQHHQSPANIAFTALLKGHRPPDLSGDFHYLDLGCGQGLTTCVLAAAYPRAHFTGVDFHPQHIAHARQLAAGCGLTNVSFEEVDFLDLARALPAHWPPVDMAVAHGIASWIAPAVREALLQVVNRALRPGGLFYVSYNTFPGWLAMVPFQHLVASFQEHHAPGLPSLDAARGLFSRLKEADAALMTMYPGLVRRLTGLDKQDPAYLVQEFNNGSWQPLFVNQMMAMAADAKLTYLASATLVENFEPFYLPAHRQILSDITDPALKELCRDLLINQAFRRDLYVKGRLGFWGEEALRQIEAVSVVAMAGREDLEPEAALSLNCSLGELRGDPRLIRPLLEALFAGPTTIAALRRELAGVDGGAGPLLPLPRLLRCLALLMEKRLVGLDSPAGSEPEAAERANAHLVRCIAQGAPYGALAAARVGTAIPLPRAGAIVLEGLLEGVPGGELAAHLQRRLAHQGRLPRDGDGRVIDEPVAAIAHLQASAVDPCLRQGLPLLQRLGGWPVNRAGH